MKIDLDVLKAVAEDIDSAVDQLRGFAGIKELRAVLEVEGDVTVVVTVENSHSTHVEFIETTS